MTDRHHERAQEVVRQFQERLSSEARSRITDAQFEDLALLIRSAIAEELRDAVDIVEEAVNKLRHDVERPQLEL